jgi:putative acetyltransferase
MNAARMSVATALPTAVRLEQAGDAAAVRAVLADAFGGPAEADLVDRLRASDDIVLALVAELENRGIVGHIGFPRLAVDAASGSAPAVALAPLAVAIDLWNRGIGSALIGRGLALLAERGEQLVFVLGDPAYYGRFGFDAAAAASFVSPYSGPHFMALRLAQTAPSEGTVRYPSAFADLG